MPAPPSPAGKMPKPQRVLASGKLALALHKRKIFQMKNPFTEGDFGTVSVCRDTRGTAAVAPPAWPGELRARDPRGRAKQLLSKRPSARPKAFL